jgi:hypothetical protein
MEIKIGNTYYVKSTIGISHIHVRKVTVLKIRKEKGVIISYRSKQLEDFTLNHGFEKEVKYPLITHRAESIGMERPYQFYESKAELMQSLHKYFDNQIKLIEIARQEVKQFS